MSSLHNQLPIEIRFEDLPNLKGSIVIDCRTEEEFEIGCLDRSINIPLQHLSIRKDDFPYCKEDHIFVYCKSGNRSGTFAAYLRSIGFSKCQSIAGGFEQWGGTP